MFFSSCVDESQLCRGRGLCTNNEDLEWCQNGQRILTSVEDENLPYKNSWEPISKYSECTLPNSEPTQTEISIEKKPYANKLLSSHQQIETAKKGDGLAYHCFNRADETPFHKAINTDALEEIEKNWTGLVNTPCPPHGVSSNRIPNDRRCFGKAVTEECIRSFCK